MVKLEKYVPYIIGVVALIYFTLLCAPNMTWINTDCDGTVYLRAAKYFTLSHSTGAPLNNLINWVFVRIPLGSEFWRISMVSVLASTGTAVLLYYIAKRYTGSWRVLIPSTIWLGSGLVVSQSTIAETYALITLCMVAAYYLHITNHRKLKYVACMLGIGIHHLIGFVLIPLIIADVFRDGHIRWSNAKPAAIVLLGALFYLYIPLANNPPYLWIGGTTLHDYFTYFTNASGLVGGLAILPPNDLFVRWADFSLVFFSSFAVSTLVIAWNCYYGIKNKQYLLPALFLLPIVYYLTDFAPQTYVYLIPSIAFGALITVLYEPPWKNIQYILKTVLITSVVLLIANIPMYDIGNTLDPNLTEYQFYNALDDIPRDAMVFGRGWQVVWLYNNDNPESHMETMTSKFIIFTEDEVTTRLDLLTEAWSEDRLYRTYTTDLATEAVGIEKWNAADIDELEYALRETHYKDGKKK